MQDETESTVSYEMEEEYTAILPEGYTEGNDFFDPDSWTASPGDGSASDTDTSAGATESTGTDTETASPATEEQTASEETGDNTMQTDTAPATEQTDAQQSSKRRVKYQFNHEEVEEEFDDNDLPEIFQRARSIDRYKERANKAQGLVDKAESSAKALGYNSAEEMLDAVAKNARESYRESLLDKGVPEEIADDYIERKFGPKKKTETVEAPAEDAQPAQTAANARDVNKEALEFIQEYPHMRGQQLPQEVLTAWSAGKTLKDAYRDYKEKSEVAETERLRKENAILKQNAASAAKAPVSGVSKGGSAEQKPDDDFLKGFNSDNW